MALWWPEHVDQDHNEIDLFIIGPDDIVRTYSAMTKSVFQRASVSGILEPGLWKIHIQGYAIPSGTQEVYLAASIRFN